MARTFSDPDFLTWEVYPSSGDFGFSTRPHLVFNCLTDRMRRPKFIEIEGDEADAEKLIGSAAEPELQNLFARAEPVP